jgi:S1-C subfamily serine protease
MSGINFVDLVAVVIVGLAMYFGWRSGFVIQALALVGFLAGIAIVVFAAPLATSALSELDPWLRSLIVIGAIALIVLLAQGVGSRIGASVRRRLGSGILGGVDMGVGAAFGVIRGLFLVWLIGGLATVLPLSALATEAHESTILRAIDTRLPSPAVLAAQLGQLLESTGLPEAFVGAPPPADIPAGGPTDQQAEQIAGSARSSTVRVEAVACGNFVSGTAFAVSTDHFVTNAHVVAGSTSAWISFDGALERYPAHVVLFDPSLDAAVIAVDHPLDVKPLTLSSDLPPRGESAAALGYTGGGRLRLIPALISRSIDALGRDIYGDQIIARNVIEMRADVAPGDSGGPVLLPDGTVGGVTFSESRDQPSVGYALSPIDVEVDVSKAINNTNPVATGACLAGL